MVVAVVVVQVRLVVVRVRLVRVAEDGSGVLEGSLFRLGWGRVQGILSSVGLGY